MKSTAQVAATLAVGLLLACCGKPAHANDINEDGSYKFKSEAQRNVEINGAFLQQEYRAGILKPGGAAGSTGAGGLGGGFGGSASSTNNFFQTVQQISCTASGGANLVCTNGPQSATATQTSTDSSAQSTTTVTGNTVHQDGNTVNNGN